MTVAMRKLPAAQAEVTIGVKRAETWDMRLIGLLGCTPEQMNENLWLPGTHFIHTIGMAAPLDVIYLDAANYVLAIDQDLKPGKFGKKVAGCRSVLEMPAGEARRRGLYPGAKVRLRFEDNSRARTRARRLLIHHVVNIFLATAWLSIVREAYARFHMSGSFLPLMLLIFNTLIVGFFLTRRPNRHQVARFMDWFIPLMVVLSSFMLRPLEKDFTSLVYVSSALQFVGIFGMLFGLLSLGRSFGIVPGHRGLKTDHAYRYVRHPLYASELIFYAGFLLGNWDFLNALLVVAIATGQFWRANAEEKLLVKDRAYIAYRQRTPYRFIPGVY